VNANPAHPATLAKLAAVLVGIVLLACVMSPPLYWIGSWLAGIGLLPIVEGFPFHRYFSRSVQISAFLLLWPAFRWIGIRRLSQLGLRKNSRRLRDLGLGAGFALVPVVVLGACYLHFGVWDSRSEWEASGFLRIAGTAAAVSVLEEFLFRGVFLGLALMAMGPVAGAMLSAAVFAGIHFVRTARMPDSGPVTWSSGFEQLPLAFSSAPPWPLLGWGMASLFLAGIVLAFAALRTRSLFLAIGIHAGWIFGQQGINLVARFQSGNDLLPWVGPNVVSGAVPTGLVPAVVILVPLLAVLLVPRHAEVRARPS
jgi:uncharacterized protein